MITDEYLRPGDLRTAEDALSWLRERAIAADEGFVSRAATLDEAHADLAARLDREYRQACRRAALDNWQMFRHSIGTMRDIQDDPWRGIYRHWALDWLALALHFRAEARRP